MQGDHGSECYCRSDPGAPRSIPWKIVTAAAVIFACSGIPGRYGDGKLRRLLSHRERAPGGRTFDVQSAGASGWQRGTRSIQRDPTTLLVQFQTADASGSMPVTYKGVLPDIFADNVEVVVEGKYSQDGTFNAGTLLAKCPSKFESA